MFQSKLFYLCLALLWGAAVAWVGVNDHHTIPDDDLHEVKLRNIGHLILSAFGDDSSRVMPIEKISDDEFTIRFERVFAFLPDSIVDIVRQNLEDSMTAAAYSFQVLDCATERVVYSFSISGIEDQNIIPCAERRLPTACYTMRLKYVDKPSPSYSRTLLMLVPFLLVGFLLYTKNKRPLITPSKTEENPLVSLGQYHIDLMQRCLFFGHEKIPLSVKEYDLLQLFMRAPNQLLERDHLLKTIWEDQGVIVGRSLDVFVSKLRKKLSRDENIRLTSVHGKGYMLEILPSA